MRVSITIFLFIGLIALMGVQVESTLLLGKLVLIKGKILITLLKIKSILEKLAPKEEEEEEVHYAAPAPSYGPPPAPAYGPPPAGTSSYASRKRRSVKSLPEYVSSIVIPDEESIDHLLNKIYKRDSSRCIEKLVCDIAAKTPVNVTQEEAALLELAQSEPEHGFAFRRMEAAMKAAMKAGFGGSDCKILFDSCPFGASQMMKFIKGSKTVVRDDDSD